MDNDKIRRGKPSTHIKFGEASAVLLRALCYISFWNYIDKNYLLNYKMKNEIIKSLASCSGHTGIAGGQELDLGLKKQKNKTNYWDARKKQENYLIFVYVQLV